MKKFVSLLLLNLYILTPVFANIEKNDAEYLQSKKHFAIINPFAESLAQHIIKKALKKEIGPGKYKVKFIGYTLNSMKKGIFKKLEIEGKNLTIDQIPVSYLKLNTTTNYNWIDFHQKPIKIKSDINFDYSLELSEKSINEALNKNDYQKILDKVNKRADPLFAMQDVKIRVKNNKVYIIMNYILPLVSSNKIKNFMVSSDFKVEDGKILATNVQLDKSYGNLPLDKITNLINLLDPLSFTLNILKEENCQGKIDNVKIESNNIQINGRILIKKGE